MNKKLLAAATVLMCMTLGTSAMAKDHDRDRKQDRREHERWEHRERERRAHYREARWDGDHHRDHDRRPPGWDKGKKKGWGNCDVPPGQAKKQGCYNHVEHRRRPARRVYRDRVTNRPRTGGWHPPTQTTTTTTTTKGPGAWQVARERARESTNSTTTQPAQTQPGGGWRVPNK